MEAFADSTRDVRTVKGAPRTTGIVPAIGTAATHLPIVDDAFRPRPMPLVAVLARPSWRIASDLRQKRFDVAAPHHVEVLRGAPLCRRPDGPQACELPAQRAVNLDHVAVGVKDELLRGARHPRELVDHDKRVVCLCVDVRVERQRLVIAAAAGAPKDARRGEVHGGLD